MEIHTSRFDLDWQDTTLVLKMIKANYAKEEIIKFNYFQNAIPQDYEYLKHLCKFDFTTEPQKWKNEETKEFTGEYLDWSFALDVLCEICINIFDVLYHIGVASYSPKYTEHYDIYERMILWSEERHKDDDLIEEIINLSIGKALSTPEEKDARLEKLWDELEDVLFDEGDDGELYLADNWGLFAKGTTRTDIWHWFDERHSKGVAWLLNDYPTDKA